MELTAQEGKDDREKRTHRKIEVAFHLRLATSCNVLGTAEPATIT